MKCVAMRVVLVLLPASSVRRHSGCDARARRTRRLAMLYQHGSRTNISHFSIISNFLAIFCFPNYAIVIRMIERNYQQAQNEFMHLMQHVSQKRETVIISEQGQESVAWIAADELRSLQETAHLLRSPKNAQRLLTALQRALANQGEVLSDDELAMRVGL